MLPGLAASVVAFARPGSVTLTTAGVWSFVTPNYSTSIVIELWGPGSGGGGVNTGGTGSLGSSDTTCTQLSLIAGRATTGGQPLGTAGIGGVASGGDVNINGANGNAGGNPANGAKGGDSPNGGTGGAAISSDGPGNAANAPGGGGGGAKTGGFGAGGGGAGAYCSKTLGRGVVGRGVTLSGLLGSGGAGGTSGSTTVGGAGARGQVKITWT